MSKELRPRTIRVDASSICQLKCPICPNALRVYDQSVVGYGYLRESDFKNLLEDNPWLTEIELCNSGEVFLNPELLGIMEYAHRKGVILAMNSGANLNTVKPEVLEGLVKYQVRSIACAIDGTTNEAYAQYRVNGNLDNVLENVKTIVAFKKKYRSRYPLLRWQFVIFGHNERQISEARAMADSLGMRFEPRPNVCPDFSPVRDEALVRSLIGAANIEEFRRTKRVDYGYGECLQLWDAPQVNWDGTMIGCCMNIFTDYGNVFRDGLVTVLNGEKMRRARRMVSGEEPASPEIWCSACPLYQDRRARGWWVRRGLYHRTVRSAYENLALPYAFKLAAYRRLRGPYALPPLL